MVNLVENYLEAVLGKKLINLGVSQGNFSGNGALSFKNVLKEDINSIIGEGNYKLWAMLEKHYGKLIN